ncbi:MAG: hypothetical protein SGI91_05010 [Alphaproteobacteria bacterium]|jgi:hypothetical protein|nr:hypothetical protein [Alphaproteobacteria bacterium]
MKRLILVLFSLVCLAGVAQAQPKEEDVTIRGNFPQLLARGETVVEMANRMAVKLVSLDRLIAPPCGMPRIFQFAGADYVDINDASRRVDPGQPGVWRIQVQGKGCWTPRLHNVFLFPRGASPAELRVSVPGSSSAGVKHQQDTTRMVLREANSLAARSNCDERAYLVEASVTKSRRPGQSWTESWSASACDLVRKFSVTFTPEDGKMRIMIIPA